MKYIFSLLLFLVFSCAPTMTLQQRCNSWMHHDINELVRAWGPPTSTFDMPNGNRAYTWTRTSTHTEPSFNLSTTIPMTIGGGTTVDYCRFTYEVAPSGEIIFWRYDGNACY